MEVLKPYSCERRCSDMTVHDPSRNVIIINGDRLHLANCQGLVLDQPTGELVWNPVSDPGEILFVSCTTLRSGSLQGRILASDCVNATLVQADHLKDNFTLATLMAAWQHPTASRRLSPINTNRQVPLETELVIYNRSKLLVNLEVFLQNNILKMNLN